MKSTLNQLKSLPAGGDKEEGILADFEVETIRVKGGGRGGEEEEKLCARANLARLLGTCQVYCACITHV